MPDVSYDILDKTTIITLKDSLDIITKHKGVQDEYYEPILKVLEYYMTPIEFKEFMSEHQKQLDSWVEPRENYN